MIWTLVLLLSLRVCGFAYACGHARDHVRDHVRDHAHRCILMKFLLFVCSYGD